MITAEKARRITENKMRMAKIHRRETVYPYGLGHDIKLALLTVNRSVRDALKQSKFETEVKVPHLDRQAGEIVVKELKHLKYKTEPQFDGDDGLTKLIVRWGGALAKHRRHSAA